MTQHRDSDRERGQRLAVAGGEVEVRADPDLLLLEGAGEQGGQSDCDGCEQSRRACYVTEGRF